MSGDVHPLPKGAPAYAIQNALVDYCEQHHVELTDAIVHGLVEMVDEWTQQTCSEGINIGASLHGANTLADQTERWALEGARRTAPDDASDYIRIWANARKFRHRPATKEDWDAALHGFEP